DRRAGDAVLEGLRRFLVEQVDPNAVDASCRLPDGLFDGLRSRGYLALRNDPALGGLGLSLPNAFRAIDTVASWSAAVGWPLSIQNGLGAGAYMPLLPPGPLRDLV